MTPSTSRTPLTRRGFIATSLALTAWATRAALPADAIRIGICSPWKQHEQLRRHGFDYLEENVQRLLNPAGSDEDFRKVSADVGVDQFPILACNGFFPRELQLVGSSAQHDRAAAWAEIACRRAAALRIPVLVLGSGRARRIPDGFARAGAETQFTELGRRLGEIAHKHGITIAVESLNSSETNFLNRLREVLDLVDAVGHPNFQAVADLYHMAREDEGPDALRKAGPRIRHVHIAEREKRTAPGHAGDDFRPYFHALKAIGYRGGISMECGWKDLDSQATGAIEYLKKQWLEA